MRDITISVVKSRKQSTVRRVTLPWDEFVDKLRAPVEGSQTLDEYLKLDKEAQVDAKDVGGYVGGTFTGNRRKRSDLKGRDILTFDLDSLTTSDLVMVYNKIKNRGVTAVIHSTRKHTKEAPRIRLIILLDRMVTGEEYEALARIVAYEIGMEFFDPTTFQPARLMFNPSVCKNAEYIFKRLDGKPLDASKALSSVPNWKDTSKWHYHPSEAKTFAYGAKKQQNPLEKEGIVGAFCKTYTVYDVLDELIPGTYIETHDPDRFTYLGATTTGGAVVYDDGLFMYSNHATDPAGGMLLNAFDLVRIHKFGGLDEGVRADTAINKLPSYAKMCEFAAADENVKKKLLKERFRGSESESAEGLKALSLKKDGMPKATINNVVLILQFDEELRDKIKYNEFSYSLEVTAPLPWEAPDVLSKENREWEESDDANLYNYVETRYGIANRRSVDEALTIVAHKNAINPVRDYLMSLSWDKKQRVATMFTDYLGAADSKYTQTVAVKCMAGAVARVLKGGVKYDYMPILTGKQGIGKSTFLANLGMQWFTDSLTTFDSKTGAELIQGKWIAEVGELAALKKHEIEVVKQFITRTSDRYRAAYGRRAEDRKRRCVFFGTSNEDEFLSDITGNRRFLPISCGITQSKHSVWDDMPGLVDQLWAEAVVLYTQDTPLHLSSAEEKTAERVREQHAVKSPLEGIIRAFVELKVPSGWEAMDIKTRKLYLASSDKMSVLGGVPRYVKREYISAAEVWVECLDGDLKKYTNKDARLINSILKEMSKTKDRKRLKNYGRQRVWVLK
ncbi:Virulence-associated protein E [Eubacterium saphenum ATCC 49989]|nr:Virulence-associated protein E [Eubacterium saphenum ATCC 49989]